MDKAESALLLTDYYKLKKLCFISPAFTNLLFEWVMSLNGSIILWVLVTNPKHLLTNYLPYYYFFFLYICMVLFAFHIDWCSMKFIYIYIYIYIYINARIPQITLTICNRNLEHMLNKTSHHGDFDLHLIHTCRQPVNTATIFSVEFFIQLSECRHICKRVFSIFVIIASHLLVTILSKV